MNEHSINRPVLGHTYARTLGSGRPVLVDPPDLEPAVNILKNIIFCHLMWNYDWPDYAFVDGEKKLLRQS
jgi:hypothetical protein